MAQSGQAGKSPTPLAWFMLEISSVPSAEQGGGDSHFPLPSQVGPGPSLGGCRAWDKSSWCTAGRWAAAACFLASSDTKHRAPQRTGPGAVTPVHRTLGTALGGAVLCDRGIGVTLPRRPCLTLPSVLCPLKREENGGDKLPLRPQEAAL